jgi:hypothetical protein
MGLIFKARYDRAKAAVHRCGFSVKTPLPIKTAGFLQGVSRFRRND